jgi:hypothetical protein
VGRGKLTGQDQPTQKRIGLGLHFDEERAVNAAASTTSSVRPAPNGSEATATTEMPNLSYDEMDKLMPCRVCGSHRYWSDGEVWQCWNCCPPPSADMVRVDLHARVN